VSDATVTRLRGILDTSTVIMLSRITDPAHLPAEPLITAVTLAELSVGPLVATDDAYGPRARRACSRPKPTSHSASMRSVFPCHRRPETTARAVPGRGRVVN
jgi:hypothetical protein